MTGLVLGGAAAVRSPAGPGFTEDPVALGYFDDLLAPFGDEPDVELLRRGAHVGHHELADLLAGSETVRDSRPQLLIVTHALPDVVPFTAVAPHLTARLGGEATSFAIVQQGLAAPFTALRIAAAYGKAGRAAEVVIAVLEQTTLPTRFPLVQDTPLIDSAAALVLGAAGAAPQDGGPPGFRLGRVSPGTTSPDDALRRAADEDGTLLVLGSWVTGDAPYGPDVHRAAPGTYCTGVWLELAEHWREWQRDYHRIVLCDTDPLSGLSHLAEFAQDAPGHGGPARGAFAQAGAR
ncbi:hypothetical protein ACFYYH_10810 [Streptomyces sp. NPDC002018]|uniref:hypothetical protein n=1 Tax=Streptomyces sp. NPDC002018 TaxID=3364629 RepID=UPI0036814B8D